MRIGPRSENVVANSRLNTWARVGIVGLTLAVFALYLHTLDQQSLVFEEGLSVVFSSRTVPQLMHTLVYEDLHPPLHYLLLHFWMSVAGNGERAVRMPSAMAAMVMVPLAWAIVMEVWGQGKDELQSGARALAALGAAALVGASPFVAYQAQETRMYSLVAALSLAAVWAFLRATRTGARGWWLAFSCLLAASLYTQYLAFFVVPAILLYALLVDRESLRTTALCTLLAGLLYLPWIVPAYLQLKRLFRWPDYWVTTRIDPSLFLYTISDTLLPSYTMRWQVLVAALGALLLIRFALRSRFRLSEAQRRGLLIVLVFAVQLTLTFVTVSLAPKFVARYTIVAAAPFYIFVALALYAVLGARSLAGRALFGVLVVIVVLVSLRSTVAVLAGRQDPRDDTRGVAAYLTENAQANDALLLVENAPYAFQYYYGGSAPWHGLHVGQGFVGAADVLNGILQNQPRRVWLVLWHHEFADPTDMIVTELLRVGREVNIGKQFRGYQLRAFDIYDYETPIVALPQPKNVLNADFWPGIRLLGFDHLTPETGQLHYALYWEAQKALQRNYSLALSWQDQEGNEYLHQDQALSTHYFLPPVWPLNTPIRGRVDVVLPADLPPLTYRVYLRVLDPESQRDVDLVDASGIPLGQALLLEELFLPKSMVEKAPVEVPNLLHVDMANDLQLLGFGLDRLEYHPGDDVRLMVWWHRPDISSTGQAHGTPNRDQSVTFRLLDSSNSVIWEGERSIVPGYPSAEWRSGEVNRIIYRLTIPSDLTAGDYNLQASMGETSGLLAVLHIVPREHRYDVPLMQHSLNVQFEEGITLLGYDLEAPTVQVGETMTVTLHWRATDPITTSYKVSVQLLSSDLQILAQDDGVPVSWTYPTTAWLPREIISDQHVLTIASGAAPGSHVLIAVLYDERTARRLRGEQAGKTTDHAILAILRVPP